MLRLDREFGGLGFGHRRVCPEFVENVELEVPAERFLDYRTVGDAGACGADLDPLEDIFVDRECRADLGHNRILSSWRGDAKMTTPNRRPDVRGPRRSQGLPDRAKRSEPRSGILDGNR